MMTLASTNGHRQSVTWQTVTVRDFFSKIAWTGESVREPWTLDSADEAVVNNPLDLRLSVGEFFNRFPWDGQPHIAVPVAPLEVQPDLPPPEDDLTLDGFSDLF